MFAFTCVDGVATPTQQTWQTWQTQDLANIGAPPGTPGHPLGTDAGGTDLLAMLVEATGRSLSVGLLVGLTAPVIAVLYGTTIALWGGLRERLGMWVLDMLLLMPYFLLVAVFMGSTGGGTLQLAMLLTAFGWMGTARVIRATSASLRERDFVRAARYMGVPGHVIVRRHLVPHLSSLVLIHMVTTAFGAIVAETALSFLGVGIRPPEVSLGSLMGQSVAQLRAYPWLFWGPTVCLVSITLALALIADGIRDALDPDTPTTGAGA